MFVCALVLGCGVESRAQSRWESAQERIGAIVSETGMAVPSAPAAAVVPVVAHVVAVPPSRQGPYVVIFKGRTICAGCETPFETLFRARGYGIRKVGPGQSTPELLAGAAAYVVPGGEDVSRLRDAWTPSDLQAIRGYIANGGRYLGVCLGGYWAGRAGAWPGTLSGFEALDIIPARVLELSPDGTRGKVVPIHWKGRPRQAYFQDAPSFEITDPSRVLKIYATYDDNGYVAAFLSRYGSGTVAVSGVHLEATQDWYDDYRLPAPPNLNRDLMSEVLDDLLNNGPVPEIGEISGLPASRQTRAL